MATDWYYSIDGVVRGPFDAQSIRNMAEQGELKPTDQLRRKQDGLWGEARQVKGLKFVSRATSTPSPSFQPAGEVESERSVPHWLAIGATAVMLLTAVGAVGFVLGHHRGRSADKHEFVEFQSQAELATEKLKAIHAERDKLSDRLAEAIRDRDTRLAVAIEREHEASERVRKADEIRLSASKAERDVITRRREEATRQAAEETRKVEAVKKVQAARGNPTKVLFKDFVNFPEEYVGGFVRFEDVWLHGDFKRIDGAQDFSPNVSSKDGKVVDSETHLIVKKGLVFIISEDIGRPLSLELGNDTKYGANLCCAVIKVEQVYFARIYRVETRTVSGGVKDVFERK